MERSYGNFNLQVGNKVKLRCGWIAVVESIEEDTKGVWKSDVARLKVLSRSEEPVLLWRGGQCSYKVDSSLDVVKLLERLSLDEMM